METDYNILSYNMATALLFILLMIALFFFVLKRLKGGALPMKRYTLMKNLGTLSLGPRKSLALVEIGDQWFVVGVGTENISLISKIDKPSDESQDNMEKIQNGKGFGSFLSKASISLKKTEESSAKDE